jgi:tubulin gamma
VLQVSGLMLANHTSIRHLFSKCLGQYEKLRKKQAFLDNYRKFPMFAVRTYSCYCNCTNQCSTLFHSFVQHNDLYDLFMQDNDLSEFDESREIIESLVDEYKACESPDYIKWGMEVSLLPFKLFYFYFF